MKPLSPFHHTGHSQGVPQQPLRDQIPVPLARLMPPGPLAAANRRQRLAHPPEAKSAVGSPNTAYPVNPFSDISRPQCLSDSKPANIQGAS